MAVIQSPQGIFFTHPVVGMMEESQQLGEMSMELILTLHTMLHALENREQLETIFVDPNTQEITAKIPFADQPHIRDLRERAFISAVKGYNPPLIVELSSRTPNLTPVGLAKAQYAKVIIETLNAEADNLGYEPRRWREADLLFNNASIPTRALIMLKMLSEGITEAESRYAQHNMAVAAQREDMIQDPTALSMKLGLNDPYDAPAYNADIAKVPRNKYENEQNEQKPDPEFATKTRTYLDDAHQSMLRLTQEIEHTNTPAQLFVPAMYPVGAQKFEAWVPTATFGQRARTDLKHLIKFGLVEIRAFISAGRGRAKHIIKPSLPGTRVLTDLDARGISLRTQ